MKILVTGACGHIGTHIVENIHKIKGVKDLILLDNLNSSKINSLFNLKTKIKIKFHEIDVAHSND